MIKSMHSQKNRLDRLYKSYWFIIWFFIYGILIYLSTLLTNVLGIKNYYSQIIFIGIIISIIAKAISSHIHGFTFKLNFNLFIWTLIYILSLFSIKYVLSLVITNYWLSLIIISILIIIVIHLLKKTSFTFLSVIVIIISIIFVFTISGQIKYDTLNNITKLNGDLLTHNLDRNNTIVKDPQSSNSLDVLCSWRVYETIGMDYIIEYSPRLSSNLIGFTNMPEDYVHIKLIKFSGPESFYYNRFNEEGNSIIKIGSDKAKIQIIKNNLRYGSRIGENKDWVYGDLEIKYNYLNKDIVDLNNIIIGDNSFEVIVKIDDFSKYNPIAKRITSPDYRYQIVLPVSEISEIKECSFADQYLLEKRIDNLLLAGADFSEILPSVSTPEMFNYVLERYSKISQK